MVGQLASREYGHIQELVLQTTDHFKVEEHELEEVREYYVPNVRPGHERIPTTVWSQQQTLVLCSLLRCGDVVGLSSLMN